MTVSSQPADAQGAKRDIPALPTLLSDAIRIVWRHAGDYFGFAGWLLVPLFFVVAAYATGGSVGNLLVNLANVSFILLILWFLSAGTLLTASVVLHPKRVVDPRQIGSTAWQRTSGLFLTLLLAAVLELAGFLLIVPGIIIATYLTFALEEAVLNNRMGFSALSESRNLVRGRFWIIFWRTLGLGAIFGLVYLFAVTLVVASASWLGVLQPDTLTQAPPPLWLEMTISVLQIAFLPFILAAHALLYLRLEKG